MHEEKEKTLAAEEESLYKERIFWGEKKEEHLNTGDFKLSSPLPPSEWGENTC